MGFWGMHVTEVVCEMGFEWVGSEMGFGPLECTLALTHIRYILQKWVSDALWVQTHPKTIN